MPVIKLADRTGLISYDNALCGINAVLLHIKLYEDSGNAEAATLKRGQMRELHPDDPSPEFEQNAVAKETRLRARMAGMPIVTVAYAVTAMRLILRNRARFARGDGKLLAQAHKAFRDLPSLAREALKEVLRL